MTEPRELSPQDIEKIEELAEKADALIEKDEFKEAFEVLNQAIRILPEPQNEYAEATWLFGSLGDVYFLTGNFKQAISAFADAIQSPDGLGNSFLHLRLGECQFELGNLDLAADELIRAYMGEGSEIFDSEDPKYLEFLKTRANID